MAVSARRGPLSAAGLTAVTLLLAGGVLLALQSVAQRLELALLALVSLVVFTDAIDFALRLYFRGVHAAPDTGSGGGAAGGREISVPLETGHLDAYRKRLHLRPYALLVSLYNAEAILDEFCEAMRPLKDRLWLIDDGSSDVTCERLRSDGWRCIAGGRNRKKPGAIKELLRHLPREVETVLVLDPDARIIDGPGGGRAWLETVIFDFQRSRMAALSPRLTLPADGLLPRLQAFEYCLAFRLGRASLGDAGITSGIALYRRDALERVLAHHSLSVYAEDLENSFILLGMQEKVYYDGRLVLGTEAKEAWRGWFSQRVGWAYGLLRVYAGCFGHLQRGARRHLVATYQYLVYLGGLTLLLHPLKLVSLALLAASLAAGLEPLLGLGRLPAWAAVAPVYFAVAYAKYTVLALAALALVVPPGERLRLAPVVPLYFFYAHLLLLPSTVGYANWLSLKLAGRRLYQDHYQDEVSLARAMTATPSLREKEEAA